MKVMLLRSLETMSGRKEYIVMGTTYICSEDTSNVGKVLLMYIHPENMFYEGFLVADLRI